MPLKPIRAAPGSWRGEREGGQDGEDAANVPESANDESTDAFHVTNNPGTANLAHRSRREEGGSITISGSDPCECAPKGESEIIRLADLCLVSAYSQRIPFLF